MNYLKKETVLFERDEQGELLSIDVPLELLDEKETDKSKMPLVSVVPMARGEIQRMGREVKNNPEKENELDAEIVEKYCKNPKFTKEELIRGGKGKYLSAISLAILATSLDIEQKELQKIIMEQGLAAADQEVLIKKKLIGKSQ